MQAIKVHTEQVTPENIAFKIIVPSEAIVVKTNLLARAGQIVRVGTANEQASALALARELKTIAAEVEATRKEIKQPYWDAGKAIDECAKNYTAEIEDSAKRIEKLVGDFQAEERRKAEAIRQAEEAKRREAEDAARKEREKAEQAELERVQAELRAAQAEQRRIEAEKAAAEATTAKAKREAAAAKAKADAEAAAAEEYKRKAEEAAAQAEIDSAMAQETASDASAVTITQEPPKAHGASVRDVIEYMIVDVEALYAWDRARRLEAAKNERCLPTFVKLEVKARDFGQYINMIGDAERDSIPGVVFTKATKVSARSL